jgi:alpha-L-rhamnosidase
VTGRGFQAPIMNSFNHCAFGSVGEWVWRELAGINPDENQPGYKHFTIRPRPCGDLRWVKARYDSIRGPIVSNWTLEGHVFCLDVTIPANTTATVFVPAQNTEAVTESGSPTNAASGVRFLRMEDGAAVFSVESGKYCFQAITSG